VAVFQFGIIFAISYACGVLIGNLSKSTLSKGLVHFERKFLTEVDVAQQPLLVSDN